ncbi:XRE family transcriptional regulator [Streptomyces sp. NPDC102340]|uniref:XRE family transcriptional regulator n=1 Tax=unclassified Streptomyces TaxID=2593676 RepID=UPI0038166B38
MRPEETPGGATERTDLSDLVRDRMAELGLGLRTLADRTTDPESPDAGPQWKRQSLGNLVNNALSKAPTAAQLRGLAVGLELATSVVQRAASAQYFGYVSEVWDGGGKRRLFLARLEELDEERLDELDELAKFVLKRRGGSTTN